MSSRRDAVGVLRVFLASPGDLVEERQIARQVVDEVNTIVRALEVHVDLLGWEDTRPGTGRPQHIINKDVDAAHLFVGMMWRHWGTPTGTHTSGFEEEFERARQRRKIDGSPEIWLSFKTIGEEHLQDPGPQLRRVINFRQEQIERKELLFREFQTSDDWRTLFRKWLLEYVIEQHAESGRASRGIASPPPGDTPMLSAQSPHAPNLNKQRSVQLDELAAFVTDLDPTEVSVPWPEGRTVVIAHLQVIAAAAMASGNYDGHLGTHEANLVYSVRTEVELTAFERFQIVRSVLADNYDLVPGWYWFRPTDLELSLFRFVTDRDEMVAKNAVELLRFAKLRPTSRYAMQVIAAILNSGSTSLRDSLLDYLATVADFSTITQLNEAGASDGDLVEISLAVRLRAGDIAAVSDIELYADVPSRIRFAFETFVTIAPSSAVIGALASKHEFVRLTAARTLHATPFIPDDAAFSLLLDSSPHVRALAFDALIKAGATLDVDQIENALKEVDYEQRRVLIIKYLRQFQFEPLVSKARLLEIDGPEAYEAAGLEYPHLFLDRVRDDLKNDLRATFADSVRSLRNARNETDAAALERLWENRSEIMKFIGRAYVAAGLRILATHGNADDVIYGRTYSEHTDQLVRFAAAQVLVRFGEAVDAVALVALATTAYGVTAAYAAAGAIKLSGDISNVLLPLLKSGNIGAIHAALDRLVSESPEEAIPLLTKLLRHEKPLTRVHAATALVDLNREGAIRVLDEYQQGYRYYDVVCCFDRLLFAPPPLREAYRQKLHADRRVSIAAL